MLPQRLYNLILTLVFLLFVMVWLVSQNNAANFFRKSSVDMTITHIVLFQFKQGTDTEKIKHVRESKSI